MAFALPTTIRSLRVDDDSTQRALDYVTGGTNGIINSLGNAFSFSAGGATANNGFNVRGALTIGGTASASALKASTLSVSGTSALGATAISGALTTAAGLRQTIGPYTYYSTSYPGGNLAMAFGSPSTVLPSNFFPYVASAAGSLLAVSGTVTSSNTAVAAVQVFKNGAQLYAQNVTTLASNASTYFNFTFAKGAYPIAAGDRLSMQIGYSAGGANNGIVAFLTVEANG